MTLRVTILGCGSSGGVPRPGQGWGACDPSNPKNRRRRCSLLIERIGPDGVTTVLVDTGPDLREQLIAAGVQRLDGVVYTHDHADHIHGIDDLRPMALHQRRRVDLYADAQTTATLVDRFTYCFTNPPGSAYPPIANLRPLHAHEPLTIEGPGGPWTGTPFPAPHGASYTALGIRFNKIVYVPDINQIHENSYSYFENLDLLIIDALRYARHPTHLTVDEALQVIADVKPRRAILTNLHTDVDFAALADRLPPHVEPAYDGLSVTL